MRPGTRRLRFSTGGTDMSVFGNEPRQRVIQEYVPGKQVTLAHVIASPQQGLYLKLGLDGETAGALGILTITPSEGVIIAADIATKAASVEIGFLDRFGGSLVLVGDVASVEASLKAVLGYFDDVLQYAVVGLTRS
jgi:ethanolamine utilization protein EutS